MLIPRLLSVYIHLIIPLRLQLLHPPQNFLHHQNVYLPAQSAFVSRAVLRGVEVGEVRGEGLGA